MEMPSHFESHVTSPSAVYAIDSSFALQSTYCVALSPFQSVRV